MTSSKPYQYIKGWVEFYKLKFKVTPDVLIPRPESELLVDRVLEYILRATSEKFSTNASNNKSFIILDLGTGSGNIAISLAYNLRGRNVKIIATDVSVKALSVAKQNAKLHGVEDRIIFIKSDLLCVIARSDGIGPWQSQSRLLHPPRQVRGPRNDEDLIIVTNLPYIPSNRIPYLDSSVKDFEPKIALDGGKDGFELYRKLFRQIRKKGLKPKLIVAEIDYTHGELARSEALSYFPDAQVEIKTDLGHKQRILMITTD